MAQPPNTYTAYVSPRFSFEDRRDIGNRIIDYIVNRTKAGRGVDNKRFLGPDGDGKYADSYVDSNEFKTAGKTKGRINLSLSGDMLDSLEIIDISIAGRIVIGFESQEENDKSVYMREKNYDFMGLSDQELNAIVSEFQTRLPSERVVQDIVPSIAEGFLRRLLGR